MDSNFMSICVGLSGVLCCAGFSPAEASHLDYHQSQVLETTWHALEDAGVDPISLIERRVGVYVGATSHEFAVLEAVRGETSTFAATGVNNSLIANRVSYVLGVRGPSVVVDTACSSSLVAVHDAIRDLRLGACVSPLPGLRRQSSTETFLRLWILRRGSGLYLTWSCDVYAYVWDCSPWPWPVG
jgi:3-oxoacyl-(acyl-carrier-protein) synthase